MSCKLASKFECANPFGLRDTTIFEFISEQLIPEKFGSTTSQNLKLPMLKSVAVDILSDGLSNAFVFQDMILFQILKKIEKELEMTSDIQNLKISSIYWFTLMVFQML